MELTVTLNNHKSGVPSFSHILSIRSQSPENALETLIESEHVFFPPKVVFMGLLIYIYWTSELQTAKSMYANLH